MENTEIKNLNENENKTCESEMVYGIPSLALRGRVLFPNIFAPIEVGRAKSLSAIKTAINTNKLLFVVAQKDIKVDNPNLSDLYKIGTVCKVGNLTKTSGGEAFKIILEGLYRAEIIESQDNKEHFCFNVKKLSSSNGDEVETEGVFRAVKESYSEALELLPKVNREALNSALGFLSPDEFINAATFSLPFKNDEKQSVLEITNTLDRLNAFAKLLSKETAIIKIEREVAERVKVNVDKNQKEFYLREQLRAIHEELGDDVNELDDLRIKIKNKNMGEEVEEKVLSELNRMSKMNTNSPDYTVLRTYIDWILDIPFNEESVDTEKLLDCKKILESDHFGLEKVKERILEYLAVLKLTKTLKGPILCLVGPPGVGKTSVAKSVARALNRKLVRMSLGGVKDEAEVRGHRKTYIGAMPGRIIYGMKEAGTINPVFLLDEIDKLSSDLRGDPASALLEVLDPEQNATFRDRYLEIPYDLSKVMFITTANSVDTIPAPLLDRMEVIEIAGYTQEEKVQIADRYLIPKNLKLNGLTKNNLAFTEDGIIEIISGYTGEAGVRKLEQKIGAIARKVATKLAEKGKIKKVVVTEDKVCDYLGARKHSKERKVEPNQIGSATGLAWTAVGGVTLTIEVALMKGKGNLILTGKLGEVMQESAKTAISFIRSRASEYGIDSSVFETTDVHVHVPEGATPKDGPSAGITIATALMSAFTQRKVKRDIAMTGEITLRGNVLAIGGLKEKSLAAYRLGIRTVVIPNDNVKDLEEIPQEIKKDINFIAVKNIKEVFDLLLEAL